MDHPKKNQKVVALAGEYDINRRDELWDKVATATLFDVAVIDLARVTYFDSTALYCFMRLKREMEERGGVVVFANVNARIQRQFSVCGFDKLFQLFPSVDHAQAAFGRESRIEEVDFYPIAEPEEHRTVAPQDIRTEQR
jgi:anti-anti-sigma factor